MSGCNLPQFVFPALLVPVFSCINQHQKQHPQLVLVELKAEKKLHNFENILGMPMILITQKNGIWILWPVEVMLVQLQQVWNLPRELQRVSFIEVFPGRMHEEIRSGNKLPWGFESFSWLLIPSEKKKKISNFQNVIPVFSKGLILQGTLPPLLAVNLLQTVPGLHREVKLI